MTIILLDDTLEPNVFRGKRETVLAATGSPVGYREEPKEVFIASSIPEGATTYHTNYLQYLEQTWNAHSSIILSPEIMWYTILNELAIIIKSNPTAYASLFTTSDEKQTISVQTDDVTQIDLNQIKSALHNLVPTDIELFLPTFSTSTESSNMACLASFCDAVTPFYNYSTFMCGHTSVKVTGTDEDWDKIETHLTEISKVMSCDWLCEAWEVIVSLRLAIRDNDVAFWKNIFTEVVCGSGSQYVISGWFSDMFNNELSGSSRRVKNFASHIAQVPYTNVETNRKFTLNYGLFHSNVDDEGFIVPKFSYVINEVVR